MYIWVGINVEEQLKEVRAAVDGVFEKIEISNVTFSGSYTVSKLPSGREENDILIVVNNAPFYQADEGTTQTNVSVTLTKKAE